MEFNDEQTLKPKRKRLEWNEGSEAALLSLWPERVEELRSHKRHGHIYEEMSEALHHLGYAYSARDVQVKLQNFSQKYRKEKASISASGIPSIWPLYERVHKIIGALKANEFSESTFESDDANSIADSDSQLCSILYEIDKHNYLYLLERCKSCNVNARQLRYLEKDHIRELIPSTQLGILAEFEYLLKQWKIAKGFTTSAPDFNSEFSSRNANNILNNRNNRDKPQALNKYSQTYRKPINNDNKMPQAQQFSTPAMIESDDEELLTELSYGDDSMNVEMNGESPKSELRDNKNDETDLQNFALTRIIPDVLRQCKDVYKTKKQLSDKERHLLASSVVEYIESSEIKLKLGVAIDFLIEQITQHFPTEEKETWFSSDGGLLYIHFTNSYRKSKLRLLEKEQQFLMETLAGMENADNSTAIEKSEDLVNDKEGKRIQDWLKSHKCENFTEILDMWEVTQKYRSMQIKHLKDTDSVHEFLDNWPSYTLDTGHELLNMDFEYLYPQAMKTFRTRWLVYKQNIEPILEADLKDNNCLELLAKYQHEKDHINEDSSSCILIHMIHDITKPFRLFKTANGNICYTISDSQYSVTRLIQNKLEMDDYTDPYPCVFVVGNSLLEIQECYVVFLKLRYKLSYQNCLAVCVQIFTVLKVEEPKPSQKFWQFVRGYLFNIAKDKEKVYPVMENIVKYLETAGCT